MLPANTQLTLTTLPLVSDWTTRSSLAETVPVFFSVKRKVTGFWKLAVFTPPTAEPVNEYDKAVGAAATCSADDVTTDAAVTGRPTAPTPITAITRRLMSLPPHPCWSRSGGARARRLAAGK